MTSSTSDEYHGTIRLEYVPPTRMLPLDDGGCPPRVVMEFSGETTRDAALEHFASFLRAVGYGIPADHRVEVLGPDE